MCLAEPLLRPYYKDFIVHSFNVARCAIDFFLYKFSDICDVYKKVRDSVDDHTKKDLNILSPVLYMHFVYDEEILDEIMCFF